LTSSHGWKTGTRESADAARLLDEGQRFEDAGNIDLALDCYRDAVAAAPDAPRTHMNVALALQKLGRTEEALTAAQQAIQCDPSLAPARFNLSRILVGQGDLALAEVELNECLRLVPNFLDAHVALADIRELQGDDAGCERELRTVLAHDARHRGAALNLFQLLLRQRRFSDAERFLFREMAGHASVATAMLANVLASLNESTDADNQTIYEVHRWFGRFIEQAAKPRFDFWLNRPDPERRLRIGYVSGDFREHPIAWFMRPVLQHHNRPNFDVYCYSTFGGSNDRARALQSLASHWRDVSALSDRQLAEQIRHDAIDVLVDLSGHTAHNRLAAFALRPAPVQATWLGYLNTTGLTAIDWRICDRHTDPAGETDRFHVERLFRMPASQWCYEPWHDVAETSVPSAPGSDPLVFGSFNQHERISDECLDLWSRLLHRLPNPRLRVFDVRNDAAANALEARLLKRGIARDRFEMHGRLPLDAYFEAIRGVNIALDTTPYSGATTALNVLWMGVPVVGLRGRHSLSRGCFSVLKTLGLPDLCVETPADYVAVNLRLANAESWRRDLRSTLRQRMRASPLMDAPAFVSALEAGYRMMWHAWCRSTAPGAKK
jgi:predicted O-linked N-acetylglucosamine transferase (SPINDLY family)